MDFGPLPSTSVTIYVPASSPFFGVLPFVDGYLKRQMYRDRSLYFDDHEGGNLFTDYVSNVMGIDLDGWDFSSTPDPLHIHLIRQHDTPRRQSRLAIHVGQNFFGAIENFPG